MAKALIVLAVAISCNSVLFTNAYGENPSARQKTSSNAAGVAEYLNLRLNYSKSPEYNPYDSELYEIIKECDKLIDAGKFNEAIEKAKIGLKKDKYNIQLLVCMASVYRAIGDVENADRYRRLWSGLGSSILAGGDGKSAKSAFTVISVDEEYAVLQALKLRPVGQKHIIIDGVNFDVHKVKKEGADTEFDLYFNIDVPFKWLAASLKQNK